MITYYVLTDIINKDCIIRFDDAIHRFERYNVARASWIPDYEFFGEYLYEDSPFYDFYREIDADAVQTHIDSYKARWSGYWKYVLTLNSGYYLQMPSPVKGQNYKEYCEWLADCAMTERDRVLYGLSGLAHMKDWRQYAQKLGMPELLQEFLSAYAMEGLEIFRSTNKFILDAKKREYEMLLDRGDLVNKKSIEQTYVKLSCTYTPDQVYLSVLSN